MKSIPTDAVQAPTNCPHCRSAKISVPGKKATSFTYWRCEACGEMWNVSRQRADPRPYYGRL